MTQNVSGSDRLTSSLSVPPLLESGIPADELALDMSAGLSPLKGGLGKCYSKPDQRRRLKISSSKAGHRSGRRARPQIE